MLTACSNNEQDEIIRNDITGSWYGTRSYYNPASGTKYQYLRITFESNGVGDLEYNAPSSLAYAKFSYKISGNKILCNGYFATDAYEMDSAEPFEMSLSIEKDRLIPIDRYSYFILTKDDSVMTDGDGNEIIDNSHLLNNIWVRTDGYSVCVINDLKCTEYSLLTQYGKIYRSKSEYKIYYDPSRKIIRFGTTEYDIVILNSSVLEIRNDTNHFVFEAGDSYDIPSKGDNGNDEDLLQLLTSSVMGWKTSDDKCFNFTKSGVTTYLENSHRKLGSFGEITLGATGTYSLNNKQITCKYTDISWESGNNLTKDWFPGWTCGGERTRKFIIKSITSDSLILEDENGVVYRSTPI